MKTTTTLLASDAMPCSVSSSVRERGEVTISRNGYIEEAERERDELRRTNEELQLSFDLRWKADQRAIKRWQAAHPGNDLTWPDHADMVVWLLEQISSENAIGHAPGEKGTANE